MHHDILFDPLEEKPIGCGDIWDLPIQRTTKAYIASDLCGYSNDKIAEKLGIKRYHASIYVHLGKKSFDRYADMVIKLFSNAVREGISVKEACKKVRKNKYYVCNALYHAIFINHVITGATDSPLLVERLKTAAFYTHVKVFPLFLKLYNALRKAGHQKVSARLKGKRWHVSVPSAVYTFYIIYRVNNDPLTYDLVNLMRTVRAIRVLTGKDINQLLRTREDARLARELALTAIKVRLRVPIGELAKVKKLWA